MVLLVVVLAYIAAAAIAYAWCLWAAKPIPHPDWIWEQSEGSIELETKRAA